MVGVFHYSDRTSECIDRKVQYNWHRYYDPSLGRYISVDPIGQAGGINVYSYALNDPVNWFDPFGLAVNIVITRTGTTPNSVTGTFTASSDVTGGSVSGHTLEDPNPPNPNLPVPDGSYSVELSRSRRNPVE
ncbi:MAG: RHS repeat-associated core domain-containing protein [Spirochaetaceae bacterium]|nr:RHS repeat-associated core domain-containing protein [Myxococcales bacterium]MCB9726730.1 RHS repeat-associated core domain-containing protein [Spirochaetaceae bacterium]